MCDDQGPGIEIVVQEDRWDAYGPITPRSTELYNQLVSIGGINETVKPGVYIFNIYMLDDTNAVLSLELKE